MVVDAPLAADPRPGWPRAMLVSLAIHGLVWGLIARERLPLRQPASRADDQPAGTLAVSVHSRPRPSPPAALEPAGAPRAPTTPPRRRPQPEERHDLFAVAAETSSAPDPRGGAGAAPVPSAASAEVAPLAVASPAAVSAPDPESLPAASAPAVAAAPTVDPPEDALEVRLGEEHGASAHGAGASAGDGDLGRGPPATGSGGGVGPGARRRRRPIELFGRVVGGRGCAVPAHAAIPCASLRESTALRARDHFPRLPAALWPDPWPYVVRVEICVSAMGAVADAVLLSSESERFDPLVLEAVQGWVYRPRLIAGAPAPFCHSVVIQYDSL